jgi:site-specific DNA-adenine methylase
VFGYLGNKRNEVKDIVDEIVDDIDMDVMHTIVEPFCGSSAVSYYISTLYPQRFMYHLNDINKQLIELYRVLMDGEKCDELEREINAILSDESFDKIKYLETIRSGSLAGYFIKHKVYNIRVGLFPCNYVYKKITLTDAPIVRFLRTENVVLTNDDATTIVEQYEKCKRAIMYLDPPYLQTCNEFYIDATHVKFNIYEYLYYKKYKKSNIYASLEDIWITKILFDRYQTACRYSKQYETSKKKTTHILYRLSKRLVGL